MGSIPPLTGDKWKGIRSIMGADSERKKAAFGQKMVDVLNAGALNLALGIGYKVGLFEVLSGFDGPRTSDEIAGAAGLDARYVREWLGVMGTGEIVEVVSSADGECRYQLPPEHAGFLTRAGGNANLGVYTQEIPLLTTLSLEGVLNGFHTGEGVPYSCYPSFQAFMTELSNAKHREVLVNRFLPSVDDGRLLERLRKGISVCDLGCGEGTALLLMAEAFPASRFTGIDLAEDCLELAASAARERRLGNVEFLARDAALLEADDRLRESFDYVTAFDAIHDQTRPLEALRGARAILAPGGAFSMIDIAAHTSLRDNLGHPMGAFLYTVSLMHCMPVGLVDGGAGLGMMWGREQAVEMLEAAGFKTVEVVEMADDPFNLHFFCRR